MWVHQIGTEHLLLGLIRIEANSAIDVLRALDVDPEELAEDLSSNVELGTEVEGTSDVTFTPESQQVLKLAHEQWRETRDAETQIGTAHLLLGLALEGSGEAFTALSRHGVDAENIRETIMQMKH